MATESDVKRYQAQLLAVRRDIARESAKIATKRKKAADSRASASRSKSESTIRSRLREAERAESEANRAEQARAKFEGKVGDLESKIHKAQADVEKRRNDDQKRALRDMERRTAQARSQFTPSLSLGAPRPTPFVAPETTTPSDVFLSHASEDKEAIARPLKDALEARGVTVWFDEIQITVGKSIRKEIEKGIAHARFGVVVLSPDFLRKEWTQAELDALFGRKMDSGEDLILPVWHKVTKQEVLAKSPLLAGIHALNSAVQTPDEMAELLVQVVRSADR